MQALQSPAISIKLRRRGGEEIAASI